MNCLSTAAATTTLAVSSVVVAFGILLAYRLGHRAGTRGYLKMLIRAGSRLGE